jgi:hypothetical protein
MDMGSKPFSARTIPPLAKPEVDHVAEVIEYSRKQFSRPRAEVEELVKSLVNMGKEDRPAQSDSRNKGGEKRGDANKGSNRNDSKPRQEDSRTESKDGQSRSQRAHAKHENKSPERTEQGRPAISKDKEFELKKQLEEAKKRAIDELPQEDETVDIQPEKFVSLKTITTGQKEISKDNKNALKDALLKVLQQNGAPAQTVHIETKDQDVKTTHTETMTIDTKEIKKPVQKKEPESIQQEESATHSGYQPIKPGEIPEDELKKLLEVKEN